MQAKHDLNGKRIIISRTDSIGDVVLTLPVAAVLKQLFPTCTIIFLGRAYTKPIIDCCENIDEFADWNPDDPVSGTALLRSLSADVIIHVFPRKAIAIATNRASIPLRVGTTGRLYHWGRCNKLVRFTRRRSSLHEAQLNLKLLTPFGFSSIPALHEISGMAGLTKIKALAPKHASLLHGDRINLLIHPGSRGSAREWGTGNFAELIRMLPENKFRIFVTGTEAEGKTLKECIFDAYPHVTDLCGRFTLEELISFISKSDGLVAASTGPLHIAAALGKKVVGLYPPIRPMHPGRWAPLGSQAYYLVASHECNQCRKNGRCICMDEITPEMVYEKLMEVFFDPRPEGRGD